MQSAPLLNLRNNSHIYIE